MNRQRRKQHLGGWLRAAGSALVLVATFAAVGRAGLLQQLAHLRIAWLGLATLLLVGQFPLMAARWCFFAKAISAGLAFRRALGEYFLSSFLNQVLPFGVLGDVTRVLRHARLSKAGRRSDYAGPALAVVLERASGQLGLWLVVLAVLPTWTASLPRTASTSVGLAITAIAVSVAILLVIGRPRRWVEWRDRARATIPMFLAPRALVRHLPLSLLLVALHTAAFVSLARAFGFSLSFGIAIRVVPLVLVATTLPFFFGGWGVREASVAGLYHLAGLGSADGVSVAVTYGFLSLLVSLPGLFMVRRSSIATTAFVRSGSAHEQALR